MSGVVRRYGSDGGPAFPAIRRAGPDDQGMTLRDYFAAHATEKDIWQHRCPKHPDGSLGDRRSNEEARYAYADAMLAAREADDA